MKSTTLNPSGNAVTVRVPMTFRRRGGRKLVTVPDGKAPLSPRRPRIDNTLIKAIVQAHRWKNMLEAAEFNSVKDLARAERVNHSCLYRVLRLSLLCPVVVQAILDGMQPASVHARELLRSVPREWQDQVDAINR